MSQSTLILEVYPQTGLLIRLNAVLSRYGLRVVGQQQTGQQNGLAQLLLTLSGDRQVDREVRSAILAVDGVVECPEGDIEGRVERSVGMLVPVASFPSVTRVSASVATGNKATTHLEDTELQQSLREAFNKLEPTFPRELQLLRQFGLHLPVGQRQRALHALGRQLGRRKYRAEYAEGSPLPLAQALRRVVGHAFRQIAPLDIHDHEIVLRACPLCPPNEAAAFTCNFFAGFTQGLLEDAPLTRGVQVEVTQCGRDAAAVDHSCICTIKTANG